MKNPVEIPCVCGRFILLAPSRDAVVSCGTQHCSEKAAQVRKRRAQHR